MNRSDSREERGQIDDSLVERFKGGDEAAFDQIYQRYRNRIYSYVRRMLRNNPRAEDITQEVFVRVYVSITTYRPEGLFNAWIYRIATNLSRNELRKNRNIVQVSLSESIPSKDDNLSLIDLIGDESQSPDELMKRKEMQETMERVLESMPEMHKEAIVLCVIEGLSYEEAAAVIGINSKAVSTRLSRARKMFIEKIDNSKGWAS